MPGDEWQQFANLRLLYAMQWAQPGKKLLFMGGELATRREWAHDDTLDWSLHDIGLHSGVRAVLADLNRVYADEPALHRGDSDPGAMRWVEGSDADRGVFAWLRLDPRHQHLVDDAGDGNRDGDAGATDPTARPVLCVMNATPMPQHNYRLGVPQGSRWVELVNTDAEVYGGSGVGNFGGVDTVPVDSHGFHQSIVVSIPPLGALFLAPEQ
jgi:1,4-alpha-glucan branching enzyme